MKLKNTDKLEVIDRKLKVNGRTFIVQYPDQTLYNAKDNVLETIMFKGCGCTITQWKSEEIEGYFFDQESPV
jgi:hypothetical protein